MNQISYSIEKTILPCCSINAHWLKCAIIFHIKEPKPPYQYLGSKDQQIFKYKE